MPPGEYTVVLEQISSGPFGVAPTNPVLPGLTLRAAPASGPPGATITITGTLATPLPSKPEAAEVCWDGCPDGLSYIDTDLHWVSSTVFQTTIVAPAAPWVSSNPPQVAGLASGDYAIGVRCLQNVQGCGAGGAEATTTFHLDAPSSADRPWCVASDSCAQLTVSPRRALPGQQIMISGFAPLASIGAGGRPFTYQLQVVPGAPSGPTVRFEPLGDGGGTAEYFGFGGLTVASPPSFASLKNADWFPNASTGWQSISANPDVPDTTAWCSAHAISMNVGGHLSVVSTKGVQAVLTKMGFPPSDPADATTPRTCDTLAVLGSGAAPPIAAGFHVAQGGPDGPEGDIALLSRDAGNSWTPMPVPRGVKPEWFGGFRYQHSEVAALFSRPTSAERDLTPVPPVEASDDGGRSWHSTNLACPERGQCMTFGPLDLGNCAKNQSYQPLVSSADGGQHWRAVSTLDDRLGGCYWAQLVALPDGSEILINTGSTLTVQRTSDEGRTWQYIGIPMLPGQQANAAGDTIVATPTGSLVAPQGTNRTWMVLRPGATSWCASRTAVGGGLPSWPAVLGDQLWWLTTQDNDSSSTINHVAATDLTC